MSASRLLRTAVGTVLILAMAAPSTWAHGTVIADGEPTAEACLELGYGRPAAPPPPRPAPAAAPRATPSPDASQVEDIVVTGSRIVRQDFEAISPVTTVGSEQLELTATLTVDHLLNEQPQIAPSRYGLDRVDTERYPDARPNPVKRVAEEPVSTFAIDVDTASYSNVRRFLGEGRLPPRDAVRVEELVNYFDYDYPLPASREEPFRPFVAVTPSPWNEGKRIVHIGLQGYDIPRRDRPPLNLVFLVDVSGSMAPQDRLPLAQQSLNLLIDQLRPQDHVSMVVYAGAAGAVLEPTPGANKLKMRCAVNHLQAGGSTAGGAGLELAYRFAERNFQQGAANRVILLTDGDFNVGVSDPEKLEDFIADKRETGVYLSVFGFGRGNYNDSLMQTLAQNGNGTAAYVDSLEEAARLFRTDMDKGLFPIADDVKIQVEFNPAQVSEWRLVGYETRLLNREDFNNDRIDAGDVGSGASVTALYEVTPVRSGSSIDPLRYRRDTRVAGRSNELAFLRIRYKLPGEDASRLMERPIGEADSTGTLRMAPNATQWAIAVASWGQKLRGDPWVRARMGWGEIRDLAAFRDQDDAAGPRAEFVRLVERSGDLKPPARASR